MKAGDLFRMVAGGSLLAALLSRPWVLPLFTACCLLPPWIAHLMRAWRFAPDFTVALDPLNPDPAAVIQAFQAAATRAAAHGSAATLAIAPLYGTAGKIMPIALDLSAGREITCRAAGRQAPPCPSTAWLPRHPLPITISREPVLLRFTMQEDKRLATSVVAPITARHQGGVLLTVSVIILPVCGPAAVTAAAAAIYSLARPS